MKIVEGQYYRAIKGGIWGPAKLDAELGQFILPSTVHPIFAHYVSEDGVASTGNTLLKDRVVRNPEGGWETVESINYVPTPVLNLMEEMVRLALKKRRPLTSGPHLDELGQQIVAISGALNECNKE